MMSWLALRDRLKMMKKLSPLKKSSTLPARSAAQQLPRGRYRTSQTSIFSGAFKRPSSSKKAFLCVISYYNFIGCQGTFIFMSCAFSKNKKTLKADPQNLLEKDKSIGGYFRWHKIFFQTCFFIRGFNFLSHFY